jgi:two-component system, NarL family, nitrate/nitrite response regulator NarL
MPGRRGDALAALTARERDVLRRVATGARTRQIAAELGIAEPTVKRHLTNIYRKLGVENRVAAATRYVAAQRRR